MLDNCWLGNSPPLWLWWKLPVGCVVSVKRWQGLAIKGEKQKVKWRISLSSAENDLARKLPEGTLCGFKLSCDHCTKKNDDKKSGIWSRLPLIFRQPISWDPPLNKTTFAERKTQFWQVNSRVPSQWNPSASLRTLVSFTTLVFYSVSRLQTVQWSDGWFWPELPGERNLLRTVQEKLRHYSHLKLIKNLQSNVVFLLKPGTTHAVPVWQCCSYAPTTLMNLVQFIQTFDFDTHRDLTKPPNSWIQCESSPNPHIPQRFELCWGKTCRIYLLHKRTSVRFSCQNLPSTCDVGGCNTCAEGWMLWSSWKQW